MPSCIIEQKRKVQLKNRKERRKTLSNDEKWMKKYLVLFNLDKVTREPCHLQRTNISANQVLNNRAKPFLKESFYFHEPTNCVFTRRVIYQKTCVKDGGLSHEKRMRLQKIFDLCLAREKWKSSIFAVIWPESSDTEPFMANNSVAKTFSKGILHISQHNTTYDQLIIL